MELQPAVAVSEKGPDCMHLDYNKTATGGVITTEITIMSSDLENDDGDEGAGSDE